MTAKKKAEKKNDNAKYLVIVESPAKSKTINKILGKDYKVMASMGHIIDLPEGKMGIDFEKGFTPEYVVMKGRAKYLAGLKKEAKNARGIYLAADPDREGEAICWHLANQFSKHEGDISRVSFEEITERAVKAAFDHPREIDMNKVNAQQARRMLDRIVGYSLSPLLWGKVTRGLSAGRVQSVAVKVIVEREKAIRDFKTEEYWTIDALLGKHGEPVERVFKARLAKHKGEKIHISSKEQIESIVEELRGEKFVVSGVVHKDRRSHPRSPYTTSVLQQDAFNKLNFSASKTMKVAQSLYEGIELGAEGSVGLITYMRTDSVRISNDAQDEVRKYIQERYGDGFCPKTPPKYRSKKRAQEAHEAVRPTLPLRHPDEVASHLHADELKLYSLIWKRFVSSQMESAVYSVMTVHIDAGDYLFRAGGARLVFEGFLKVYRESGEKEEEYPDIPVLEKGEQTPLRDILPEQHFTKPPARFTDASLVKELEDNGVGRPSTYAPIIRTIITRNYIKRIGRYLQPTELGELVNDLLVESFPDIVNTEFTAQMEGELDGIEEGREEMTKVLKDFYLSFSEKIKDAKEKMGSVKKQAVKTDENCEKCGRPMVIKWGRRGRFLSCSGFPACKNSKSITTGVKCPEEGCDGELVERRSTRGTFYGCTNYPRCKFTARRLPGAPREETASDDVVEET